MTLDLARARERRSLDRPTRPLGRVIVELGLVNRQTAEDAACAAHELGRSIGDVLLERGLISEHDLARALAARSGLRYVDLDVVEADPAVARMIGRTAAELYRAIPIGLDADGAVVVAMADPDEAPALNDIAVIVKAEVRAVVAARSAIDALIAALPEERPRAVDSPADRLAVALARTAA